MTPALLEPWLLATGAGVWFLALVVLASRALAALRRRPREDVAGRWVVVTGCDSGFGRGVVEALVARQARVIAFCFTAEGAEAALAVGAARAPRLDLRDDQAVDAAAREVEVVSGGRLWGLVHNAGVVLPGFVDYQPISFFRRVMDVNFFAPVLLTQRLLPSLRASRGRVVLVSSVDGLVSLPGNAPYDASKFAVEAYADALRAELSFWGISVSVVNPSTMRTPMAMSFFEGHRQAWEEMDRLEPEGPWKQAYPADWLDAYIDFNRPQLERMAQDPAQAVGDITHALTATRPRARYLSGWLAKTLFYALWVGPESWAARFKSAMIQPPPRGVQVVRRRSRIGLVGLLLLGGLALGLLSREGPKADAMQVTGLLHVNVNCSDFERSRRFYELLGFRVLMEVEQQGSAEVAAAVGMEPYVVRGALMALGDGSVIDLLEWRDPRDDRPPYDRLNHLGIARIALTTTDIDADIVRLKAEGVEFLSPEPAEVKDPLGGTTRFICFEDPDGTVLELVEMGAVMGLVHRASQAASSKASPPNAPD